MIKQEKVEPDDVPDKLDPILVMLKLQAPGKD